MDIKRQFIFAKINCSHNPDLWVVAGDVKMVKELNNVKHLRDQDLLLSYDTIFNLGEFYVSLLVFKHVVFEANLLYSSWPFNDPRKKTQ